MSVATKRAGVAIDRLDVSAYSIPTDYPESDGTLKWDKTTLVLVEAKAAGHCGLGYTYADLGTARVIKEQLAEQVHGRDAMNVPECWAAMYCSIRNLGRPGIVSTAMAAVDTALWDLKARLLDLPLATLLGTAQEGVPVYGSGGFTSYSIEQLERQLGGWAEQGIPRVKMKVGRRPEEDLARVKAVRSAIGPDIQLFVDANGAYSRKQALSFADAYAALGVCWFEEPVSSDDLEGLRLLRDRAPAGMDIAAGEYGYDLFYFRRMLEAGAVDILQADISRCAITGFVAVAAMCEARNVSLSGHCAPSLHVHPCCSIRPLRHLEYFHDHVRIEHMLFDGALTPRDGVLYPDLSRPGMGLEFKHADAERYAA
jgi:L-alanine-DL-glutamate epimerase-like enolase superfamily enzyme